MEAKCSDLSARCKDLADKYASGKEQVQGLRAELFDVRTKLERRDYEYGKLEAKEADGKAKLEELEAKLRQRIDEVDGVKAMKQVRAQQPSPQSRNLVQKPAVRTLRPYGQAWTRRSRHAHATKLRRWRAPLALSRML